MSIEIQTTEQIPNGILAKLHNYDDLLREKWSIDQILKCRDLQIAVKELNDICLHDGIIGYHYTRADKENIRRNGLVPLSGSERRKVFLEQHGEIFTATQRKLIQTSWDDYFTPYMSKLRDSRVYFNFTFHCLYNGNAENLLKYYGGEVVYFPLMHDPAIGKILTTLGDPLIIECLLNPKDIRTSTDLPWGKIWLSSYHKAVYPEAVQFDIDAYQQVPVSPDKIKSIQTINANEARLHRFADNGE